MSDRRLDTIKQDIINSIIRYEEEIKQVLEDNEDYTREYISNLKDELEFIQMVYRRLI